MNTARLSWLSATLVTLQTSLEKYRLPVVTCYSTSVTLVTLQNANAQAALQAAQAVMVSGNADEQTTILRVIVDNVLYPVTLEVLHQVDYPYPYCLFEFDKGKALLWREHGSEKLEKQFMHGKQVFRLVNRGLLKKDESVVLVWLQPLKIMLMTAVFLWWWNVSVLLTTICLCGS